MSDVTQTGVGFVISSSHRDTLKGTLHGHSYEIVCWFDRGRDAVRLQQLVISQCLHLDHAILPKELSWGEAIASEVKRLTGAAEVVVSRPLERIYARAK